jgi:hypothetical protein
LGSSRISVRRGFIKGFAAEGFVSVVSDFLDNFETKDSITLPSGNRVNNPTDVAMTTGTANRYAETPVAKNRITAKYVEKRTTELSACAVLIYFVGTN